MSSESPERQPIRSRIHAPPRRPVMSTDVEVIAKLVRLGQDADADVAEHIDGALCSRHSPPDVRDATTRRTVGDVSSEPAADQISAPSGHRPRYLHDGA